MRTTVIATCAQKFSVPPKNIDEIAPENIRYTLGTHRPTFTQYHQETRLPQRLPKARTTHA